MTSLDDHALIANATVDGPAVVFIHGIGGAARIWQAQLTTFCTAGYTCMAVNLPGYGGRRPVQEVTFENLATDVEATITSANLKEPALIGHSLGGMIAQTMLRRRPDAYRAAVLCCTSPAFGNPSGDFQKKFLADRLGPIAAGRSMNELAPAIVDDIIGPTPDRGARTSAIEIMGMTPDDTYSAAIRCIIQFDERANLANIRIPVLCLAGQYDRNAPPSMMERMATRIRGARYVRLPGVGHLPNLEAPKAFDAAVLEFLASA